MENSGICCNKRPPEAAGDLALGRQMTVEFYDCDARVLADPELMEQIFVGAAKAAGATVISSGFHAFTPQGVSGVVIISESHFAVHAWPEYDYAAVDLFTCGETIDFNKANEMIAEGLRSDSWLISSLINRGIVGNNGIERLVPVLESHDSRVFQLSWQSRFDKTRAQAISAAFDIYECSVLDSGEPDEVIGGFCCDLVSELGLPAAGSCIYTEVDDESARFEYPLEQGMLSGFVYPERKTVYIDLFLNGFFDPRVAADFAVSRLGGAYYRLQPHVRQ